MRQRTAAGNLGAGVMRFLIRMAFWLTVILVLLPSSGSGPTPKLTVKPFDAMSAAQASVTDLRPFCEGQPAACTVGAQAAAAIGHRAQAGAKMLYEYLSEHFGPNETGAVVTTTGKKAVPLPGARPSHPTLSPTDRSPAWRR